MTAAAIHLHCIETDHKPTVAEVMQIPRFDLTPNSDIGKLFYMGEDECADVVYVIGLGAEHRGFRYIIDQYLRLLGLNPEDYRLINCLPCVTWATRIGGYSSRSRGLVWIGRRLAAWGVRQSFWTYVDLVEKVRASDRQEPSFLDWSPPV